MASSSTIKDPVTVEEIQDIGKRLISLPSSRAEQLHLLDRVENVLRKVAQSSPQAVIEALKPITKALVADVLLKNDVRDVKVSVASCISQIMRITAPDSPYGDEELKIYFQVSVSAFEELSSLSYPQFTKVVSILESFAKFRTCILMLDLELDTEIVKMFRNLFYSIGSNLLPDVLFYMERTMTLVIEDSEELSDEIIMLLIDNLKMENQKARPLAWELGVEILKKCSTTLKKYIPKAVEIMSLDLNDFPEIVASICQDVSGKQNSEVKEATPEATDCEKASGSNTVTKTSADPNGKRDASKAKKSSKKKKSITRSEQPKSSKKIDSSKENEDEQHTAAMKGSNSQSKSSAKGESSRKTNKKQRTESEIIATAVEEMKAGLDSTEVQPEKWKQRTESVIIGTTAEETESGLDTGEAKPEKRNRKPNSLLKPEEGYWTPQLKRSSKKKVTETNSEKNRKKFISRQHGEASKVKRKSISTELKEDEETKQTSVIEVCGRKLVGCKIKVWWPEDRVFYPGKIASFDRAADKYEGEDVSGSAAPIDTVAPESETIKADIVEVRGYMVKASTARTLESIFSKYGDIVSDCPYKSASVKASLLEIVCNAVQKLNNDDSLPNLNEVESVINDAEKAKLEIGWLRVELEKKRVAHEAGQKCEILSTKRQLIHATKAAKYEMEQRKVELADAQKSFEEAERCFNALRRVQKKVKDDSLELEESSKKRSKIV